MDIGLLHDVEFVANGGLASEEGFEGMEICEVLEILKEIQMKAKGEGEGEEEERTKLEVQKEEILKRLGLGKGDAGIIRGEGDRKVLEAAEELFRLKDEGKVLKVGISGYPLPVLLRLCRLIKVEQTKKGRNDRQLDVILSYSNMTLHSDLLGGWKELFGEKIFMGDEKVVATHGQGIEKVSSTLPTSKDFDQETLNRGDKFLDSHLSLKDVDDRRSSTSSSSSSSGFQASTLQSSIHSEALSNPLTTASTPLETSSSNISISTNDVSNLSPIDHYQPPLILNGSPFSMGLLTDQSPPDWHPASKTLLETTSESSKRIKANSNGSLAITALTYGIRGSEIRDQKGEPLQRTVLGMSYVDQVHSAVRAYRTLLVGAPGTEDASINTQEMETISSDQKIELKKDFDVQLKNEKLVSDLMMRSGVRGWSWASPPKDAMDV